MTVLYHNIGCKLTGPLAADFESDRYCPSCGPLSPSPPKPNFILKQAIKIILIEEHMRARGFKI